MTVVVTVERPILVVVVVVVVTYIDNLIEDAISSNPNHNIIGP